MTDPTRSSSLGEKSSEKSSEIDLSGRQLGDYLLVRRLGRGGMAEVWLAEQCSLKRQVALKVLRGELANDDTYIQRFRIEAQSAARLIHASIIQIYEVGLIDGIHFIAQEYVQGHNLREYLVKHGPPDLKVALSVMRQVAAALLRAGEQGIVHRDIKPENIMLARNGEVKVADFGLARISGDGNSLNLTQVGMTMGTPLYMSPEQVEGRQLDPRSDIYSFGVTCYHMLAGTPPFRGETALSVAVQHLKARPEPLESLRPDLPPGLCRMVHKMLAKDPAQRYESAREILRDLRGLQLPAGGGQVPELVDELSSIDLNLTQGGNNAATQALAAVMLTEQKLHPKRNRWKLYLAALGVLLGLGVLVGNILRDRPLLADTRAQNTQIPKQPTVQEQYILAAQLNTEAAWQSIREHFPEDTYYVRRSKQQLARLYLRQREYDEALKIFEQFADLTDGEPEFRAFGLAGKAVVKSYQQQYAQSARLLQELEPLRPRLDSQLRQRVAEAERLNATHLHPIALPPGATAEPSASLPTTSAAGSPAVGSSAGDLPKP